MRWSIASSMHFCHGTIPQQFIWCLRLYFSSPSYSSICLSRLQYYLLLNCPLKACQCHSLITTCLLLFYSWLDQQRNKNQPQKNKKQSLKSKDNLQSQEVDILMFVGENIWISYSWSHSATIINSNILPAAWRFFSSSELM